MKFVLFLLLVTAFVLDTIYPVTTGITGLTLTNFIYYLVALALFTTEAFKGNLYRKNIPGVAYGMFFCLAAVSSLYYSQVLGVYGGTLIENARGVKSNIVEPVLLYGLAFLLIDTRAQGRRYLLILVVVLGMLNIASVVGAYLGFEIYRVASSYVAEVEAGQRLTGLTGNPNKTAYSICILIAYQYYLYRTYNKRMVRIVLSIIVVGELLVVLQTGSRGGLLVLIVLFITLAYRQKDHRLVYTAIALLPLAVGVLIYTESNLFLNTLERLTALISGEIRVATSGRTLIWPALLSDYVDSGVGVLIGNGFGSSRYMGIGSEPHNVYLLVLVEFGFVGLLFFIYTIFYLFRYVFKSISNDDCLRDAVLGSGFVIVVAWMVTTLVGVLDIIWAVVGIGMATLVCSQYQNQERNKLSLEGDQAGARLLYKHCK